MNETDLREIRDCVLRYCRGIDRMDLELVRSCYHPDGIDHHTGFSGSIDLFIPWVTAAISRFDGTMHFIGNHFVEGNATVAVAETYGQAVHWRTPGDDPARNFTSGFRYVDHFDKRDGHWAVAERWAVREWTRSDAGRFVTKEGDGPSPRRDREDVVYAVRRKLGL
ncbi:MAG: nuclear transport factor 2 family protein [Novosphingobium sp.]|nr:nuclear transport factor 2 family protein [Novosphingobium sp.]